ncbi:MAG: His/Gly/Thr/Pro-type tRNA ligase C-terminal domain-containing protein, partial [Candidatus Nanoarchaeia archaeon]
NYDFITIMPDGKALELGSVINLGQKFAKAFNIKYKDKSGKEQYVWQTCYGISERSLGATLAIHGDDYGLIFLPIIAPIQIIIVPILKGLKEKDEAILNKAHELKKSLEPIYRVEIDLSEKSPGEKFYHWEAKGVPLRIELGEKELKNKEYAVAIRDIKFKEKISESELFSKLPKLFYEFEERLYKKAKEFFESKIKICKDLKSAEKHIKSGIVKLAWCGEEKCGKNLEEKLVGCALGYDETEQAKGKCVACGKNAKRILYFGRTY